MSQTTRPNLLIGTSGFDYPSWRGVFYPEYVKRADFLSYYATKFNALELNYTFYSMPTAIQFKNFISRSDGRLVFCVKANRIFTHERNINFAENVKTFLSSIEPLTVDGLLGVLLFQFPQSFHYTPDSRIYLDKLLQAFANVPTAVEFRHVSWLRQSVYKGLETRRVSLTFQDMPNLANLPDSLTHETPFVGPLAYLRLHGRNIDSWYATDSANNGQARYDYHYSDSELMQFVPVIENALAAKKKTFIFFNNHPNGSGAKNAVDLLKMLNSQNDI